MSAKSTVKTETTPFSAWLRKLQGKPDVRVQVQTRTDSNYYTGTILVVEKDLVLFKEKDRSFLFPIANIVDISGEEGLFAVHHSSRRPSKNPFWRWLKALEGMEEDVEIWCEIQKESYRYQGPILRVEEQVCIIRETWKDYIFLIDNIVEIAGKEALFRLSAEVKIEEIEEE